MCKVQIRTQTLHFLLMKSDRRVEGGFKKVMPIKNKKEGSLSILKRHHFGQLRKNWKKS